MPQRKRKLDNTLNLKRLDESALMGKRMIGGEWTAGEIYAKQKLVDFMTEMAQVNDPAKFYYDNIRRAKSIIPPADRVRLLRGIAGRKGVVFKIGENPSEEEIMHRLFGTPKPKKPIQQEFQI
jgi:hypothetical protein